MNTHRLPTLSLRPVGATALLMAMLAAPPLGAESLESARVTKVVNDVRVYRPDSPVRRARPGELVEGRTSVQTGRRSRSELRFQDQTLTRLGSNSIFSFAAGTRDIHLDQGTLLLQVPKNSGGARISTPTITAAVTGTTIMIEYFGNQWAKMIVLEGTLEVWPQKNARRKVKIKAGEMTVFRPDGAVVPKPVSVDVKRIMATSALADPETFGNLPKEALDQIQATIKKQEALMQGGAGAPDDLAGDPTGDPPGAGEVANERASQGPPEPDVINNIPRRF